MAASNAELLLALRAPTAGWLAVIASVLDEANQDPTFDARQRELVAQLLIGGHITESVATAARERAARFEDELAAESQRLLDEMSAPAAAKRPELTLIDTRTG